MDKKIIFTGFSDEAGRDIDTQIRATLKLGWNSIEARNIDGINIHNLPEEKFEEVCSRLENAGINVYCFGSEVANWAKDPLSEDDFQRSIEELKRALARMSLLGTKYIRAMSFRRFSSHDEITPEIEKTVFTKVGYLVKMCEDAGAVFLHENCMNYGGMSYIHTLKLLENIDSEAFRLVFDTGNPVITYDYSKKKPYPMQDPFEFYLNVREFIEHIHIKDPVFLGPGNSESVFPDARYHFPGEGDGKVPEIVESLLASGFKGAFSIEPHMKIVRHNKTGEKNTSSAEAEEANYIEYGNRLMNIVEKYQILPETGNP